MGFPAERNGKSVSEEDVRGTVWRHTGQLVGRGEDDEDLFLGGHGGWRVLCDVWRIANDQVLNDILVFILQETKTSPGKMHDCATA